MRISVVVCSVLFVFCTSSPPFAAAASSRGAFAPALPLFPLFPLWYYHSHPHLGFTLLRHGRNITSSKSSTTSFCKIRGKLGEKNAIARSYLAIYPTCFGTPPSAKGISNIFLLWSCMRSTFEDEKPLEVSAKMTIIFVDIFL